LGGVEGEKSGEKGLAVDGDREAEFERGLEWKKRGKKSQGKVS